MITQDELLAELERRGRTRLPRTLTYWRAKWLLPPLERLSRGTETGRGALYGWSQDNIIQRALLVDRVMTETSRPDIALLVLWFSGFDVPISEVRKMWLGGYQRSFDWLKRQRSSGDSLADISWVLAGKSIGQTTLQGTLTRDDVEIIIQGILFAIFATSDQVSEFDSAELIFAIDNLVAAYVPPTHQSEFISRVCADNARRFLTLVHSLLSIKSAAMLIEGTTETELLNAREYLLSLGRFVRFFMEGISPGPETEELIEEFGPKIAVLLGPSVIRFIVTVIRSGNKEILFRVMTFLAKVRTETENDFSRIVAPKTGINSPVVIQEFHALWNELANIWNNISLFPIYDIR